MNCYSAFPAFFVPAVDPLQGRVQNPGTSYIEKLKEERGNVAEINQIIDMLVERKRTCFGSDMRVLGVYDIIKKEGGDFSLWATASDGERLN